MTDIIAMICAIASDQASNIISWISYGKEALAYLVSMIGQWPDG